MPLISLTIISQNIILELGVCFRLPVIPETKKGNGLKNFVDFLDYIFIFLDNVHIMIYCSSV